MTKQKLLTKLFVLLILIVCGNAYTQTDPTDTIYVDSSRTDGTHDGSSWENAYQIIDDAITEGALHAYLIIKLARGTYFPNTPSERDKYTFPSKRESIRIEGGYPSLSSENSLPDPENNWTIISGDIDRNDVFNPADSTYVLRGNNLRSVLKLQASSAQIDGVWIVGGNGGQTIDETKGESEKYRHFLGGGGLYIEVPGILTINRCVFSSNFSDLSGGAISVFTGGECSIENTKFINNRSSSALDNRASQPVDVEKVGGGAIYVRSNVQLIVKNSIIKNW